MILTGPLGSVKPKYSSYSSSGSMVSPGSKLSTIWLSASFSSMMARLGSYPGQLHALLASHDIWLTRRDSLLPNAVSRSVGEDHQVSIHGMQSVRIVNQPTLRLKQLGLRVDTWIGAVIPLGAENASL